MSKIIDPRNLNTLLLQSTAGGAVLDLANCIATAGGKALLVGGCVRDALTGSAPTDFDIEVYGLEMNRLETALAGHWKTVAVGRSFGVLKVKGLPIDLSIPRTESRSGPRHTDFIVRGDPQLSLVEAAARRDFTINAIYWDPLGETLQDPFGGLDDLRDGQLRHTSEKFAEDPLRVLRAMQFIARFHLTADPATVALCRQLTPAHISAERQLAEWDKLLLQGSKPSAGLDFLRHCGWVRFYPELNALIDCPQDPQWHPEGDVWSHTLHCMDAFANARIDDVEEDRIVGWAVLCHDFGKPATTFTDDDGRIRSPNHEEAGVTPSTDFLTRICREHKLIDAVIPLVREHLKPFELFRNQSSDGAIRRLARRVGRIDRLIRVAEADCAGRPPLEPDFTAFRWLEDKARQLAIAARRPAPLIKGRHLIQLGHQPGKHFKELLDQCYEAQLDGAFDDEDAGVGFLKGLLERES